MEYKSVQIRLYPNREQEELLNKNCGCSRFVFNHFLARRIEVYEKTGKSLSYTETASELTALKKELVWLKEVDSTSLQQSLKDLDEAYSNFFRRLKNGEKPGFPKFKSKGKSKDSFRCAMSLGQDRNYVKVGKHGWMRFRGNQEILENYEIRSITVSKEAGKFYASCLVEAEDQSPVKHKFKACGIDLGVKKPLTVVYGKKDNVLGRKFSADLKKKEEKRKWYQRQQARKIKGSNNSKKARLKVANSYRKEKNFRKDWVEKTSNKLSTLFETIVFEDLSLRNMTRSAKGTKEKPGTNVKAKSGLNREMLRLGLGELVHRTTQKALKKGGQVIKVDPRFTSQTCPQCGTVDKRNRKSQAIFKCVSCGYKDNADRNAAFNILRLGLAVS